MESPEKLLVLGVCDTTGCVGDRGVRGCRQSWGSGVGPHAAPRSGLRAGRMVTVLGVMSVRSWRFLDTTSFCPSAVPGSLTRPFHRRETEAGAEV